MTFLKGFLLTILVLGIIILSVIFLLNRGAPKPNQPYNLHTWRLPDGSNIKYYEVYEGHGGFTANLHQYLAYQKDSTEKKYYIAVGGSYKSLKLYLNKNANIIWLMGTDAGQKEYHMIAALDIQQDTFIGYTKMHFLENELTGKERELKKHLIEKEGVIIPEVKRQVRSN